MSEQGHLPSDLERGLEATAYWEPLAYTSPYSASVAVVQLDTDTGAVTLTQYIYVDDCGTVVNPLIVEGQVHGGLAPVDRCSAPGRGGVGRPGPTGHREFHGLRPALGG